MYLVYTVVKSALAQQEVISLLPHKEQFKDYYQTRTKKDKDRIDSFFDSCDVQRFRRLELIMAVAKPFHDTYMLLSSRDCPMSASAAARVGNSVQYGTKAPIELDSEDPIELV